MLGPPATQDFQNTISCPTLTNQGTKQWWVSYSKHTLNARQTGSLQTSRSDMEERVGGHRDKEHRGGQGNEMMGGKKWVKRGREGWRDIWRWGGGARRGGTKDKTLKVEREAALIIQLLIWELSSGHGRKPRVTNISLGFSLMFKKNKKKTKKTH